MHNILKNKEVKIRKPRICWGCGDTVPVGRVMKYVVSVDDGDFGTTYWCDLCDAYINLFPSLADDGVAQYEFRGETHYNDFKKTLLCQERKVLTEKYNEEIAYQRLIKNKYR